MLTQVQIIRSLGEALAWFEKELAWGVAPAELRHLTGRIGELYAAMITGGQMALATNQRGYDVVGADGEYISVKTITSSTHVTFNERTFDIANRIMILKVETDGTDATIKNVYDGPASDLKPLCQKDGNGLHYFLRASPHTPPLVENLKVVDEASWNGYVVKQFENSTVTVERYGAPEPSALAILRTIAADIGVSLLNSNQNPRNTRQLGAEVIAALQQLRTSTATDPPRGADPV